jgi:hypothetical protein
VSRTAAQTKAVLRRIAEDLEQVEHPEFQQLSVWLEKQDNRGFPTQPLAEAMDPTAVRLRRDFKGVLSLVKAHAILHQATRERDERGYIVGLPEDYAVVRELVLDLISEGVGLTVSQEMRDTVAAVAKLNDTITNLTGGVVHDVSRLSAASQRPRSPSATRSASRTRWRQEADSWHA